jgi:hypothetical protein
MELPIKEILWVRPSGVAPDLLLTTMTDQMEVDSDILTSSSSGGISASSSLDITELDLGGLNNRMETFCKGGLWRTRIEIAGDDAGSMLISDVLTRLVHELGATNMKSSFISSSDAYAMVGRLDDDKLKEWKAGVQDGVERNDWTALIVHRMYIWITRQLDHV